MRKLFPNQFLCLKFTTFAVENGMKNNTILYIYIILNVKTNKDLYSINF